MNHTIPTVGEYAAEYERAGRLDIKLLRPVAEKFFERPDFEDELADRRARTFVDLAARARLIADRIRKSVGLVEYPHETNEIADHVAREYAKIATIRSESGETVPDVRTATEIADAVAEYVLDTRRADFVAAVTHDPAFSGPCVRAIDDFFGGPRRTAELGISSTQYGLLRDEAMRHVVRKNHPTARDFDEPVRVAAKKILGIDAVPNDMKGARD